MKTTNKLKHGLVLSICALVLTACGGSDSSSGASSAQEERNGVPCLTVFDSTNAGFPIANSCSREIRVSTSRSPSRVVAVAAKGRGFYPATAAGIYTFAACMSPFTPQYSGGGFLCK